MSPILFLILFINITYATCNLQHHQKFANHVKRNVINPVFADKQQTDVKPQNPEVADSKPKVPEISVSSDKQQVIHVQQSKENKTVSSETPPKSSEPSSTKKPIGEIRNASNPKEMETGALFRGILVFVGFSLLFIMYLGFKTYYRNRGNSQPAMVRKYGVRTRRSDIEMTPLPLSDEDDDETLFDLSNSNRR